MFKGCQVNKTAVAVFQSLYTRASTSKLSKERTKLKLILKLRLPLGCMPYKRVFNDVSNTSMQVIE